MAAERLLTIGRPEARDAPGASRVEADVDGTRVWFESPDVALVPAPEAFASAFLLPGLAARARLRSEATLDPAWLAGSRELVKIFREWWRYPRLEPEGAAGAAAAPAPAPAAFGPPAAPGAAPADPRLRGLFFSGGVDSFHGLLCCGERVDLLVFVHGFDVPLADAPRLEAAFASVRTVAAATGVRAALVRTNLRAHPLMRAAPWERANGGALIGVAHALGGQVREMLVPSSVMRGRERSWGSHWRTDPLFGSSRVRIRQVGETRRKVDKIRELAPETLPRTHLRVCWENRAPTGNCSRCGKCVLTRLVLADCGVLDQYPVLAGTATLAADVDALPTDSHRLSLTDLLETARLDPDTLRAARALLGRVRHGRHPLVRARRAALRALLAWTGRARA